MYQLPFKPAGIILARLNSTIMKSISFLWLLFLSVSLFGQTTIDSGLIAFYPFCESASDLSGQNNHGTIVGGLTFVDDPTGRPNSAAYFNGINAFVRVPASESLDTLTHIMTLACWFYTQSYDSKWASLLSKSNATNALRQYSIIYDKDGLISFGHNLVATQVLDVNKWYHMAITLQDTVAKCYVDGILIDSNTMVKNIYQTNFPLNIGSDPHIVMEYHHGMIDDVRVYNRALTAAEVGELSAIHFDCSTISTNDAVLTQKIAFYPNPAAGFMSLKWEDQPAQWSLRVFDLQGKLMETFFSINTNENRIDLTRLVPGIYWIRIDTESGSYSGKIIKM